MNIVLGFGSTETQFEEQERSFCEEFINLHKVADDDMEDWFTFPDEMVKELKDKLKLRKSQYDADYENYKTIDTHPDRYSTYYFTVIHDLFNIVVIFDFTHINRKHALSKDGWGALYTTQHYLFRSNK